MALRHFILLLLCVTLLAACGRSDPEAELNAAFKNLQTALEKKDASSVVALLHPDFSGQRPEDGIEWAKQTMTLMFLRYKNINVVVLSRDNRIDPKVSSRAFTSASVTLTGAEGLIPDNARHFQVSLEWRLLDKKWKLIRMQWD